MASTGSSSSAEKAGAPALSAAVVVALTSHNDVRTIAEAVRAVTAGLSRAGGAGPACLVLADGGSTDGTREAARAAAGAGGLVEAAFEPASPLGELPYHGLPGRAAALRAVLRIADQAGARACVVIDARIDGVAPDWVERLMAPVLADGIDYVSPYYTRHAGEGALTRGIVYPMFRALYGVRLRQPAATEFGCSRGLVAHFLEQEFWELDQAAAGIDVRLAEAAVAGGFRAGEVELGVRHVAPRGTPVDLSTTITQVVGALFADLEMHVDVWQRVRGSVALPVFGPAAPQAGEAPPVHVASLLDSFRLGYRELREIWTWILPPRTIVELRRLTEMAPDRFRFDDRLWAGIVYDFAVGYTLRVMAREQLLRSLAPLYSGWLASFVREAGAVEDAGAIDEAAERVCLAFEAEKRHLISRWRWPERLR